MNSKPSILRMIVPIFLVLGALGLYLGTLSEGPYPGESAAMMAGELGLDRLYVSQHPLFSTLSRLAAAVPVGGLSSRLNLLSALCAALALGLFFRAVREGILFGIDVTDQNRGAADKAALVAGLTATLFLMVSSPFWYAANRFHAAAFDLMLLFALTWMFLSFVRDAAWWKGLLLAFGFGLCMVEFATLVLFGPLLLAGILMTLWNHGELRASRLLGLAGALLAGMAFYLVAGWRTQYSDVFTLNEGQGLWPAVYAYLKAQANLIARSLPQLGWILVIVVGIVPWLTALAVGKRALNEEKDKGLYVLHGILTAVAIAVLFNVPFAPWELMGPYRLLVTPYALAAATYGYLAAYWFLLPRMFAQDAEPDESGRSWFCENGGWIPGTALILLPLVAGVLNFRESDARGAGVVNAYARSVVASAVDGRSRPWLVTDGELDDHFRIAAAETGSALRLFNLRMGNSPLYMRHAATFFDNPRMQSMAQVDGMAFLQEWMKSDSSFAGSVSFLNMPDLWFTAGLQPLPLRTSYVGVASPADADIGKLWAEHEKFWKEPFMATLVRARPRESLLRQRVDYVRQSSSMVANNVGVALEDAGWRQQAFAAYAKAREFDPANVSALLNQNTMLDQGFSDPSADAVRKEMKEFLGGLKQKLHVWNLSRSYGYVRMPQAYANLGMTWVLSGQPGMAVAGFKRAIELAPDSKDRLTQGLALAYLAQDQTVAQGEALYRQLLEQDPTNRAALVALARSAGRQSRFDEAARYLERAEKAGVSHDAIAAEYAVLHLASGNADKARVILEGLADLNPKATRVWTILAMAALQAKDDALLQKCERRLERAKEGDFMVSAVLGQIALSRSELPEARIRLDQAAALQPNAVPILDLLLRLDVRERKRDLASDHIRRILLLDPGHPFANQVLASFQVERKEYGLAENSLRRSLERGRDPGILNDLAWVLQERGQFAEAELLAREAVKGDEKAPNFWDTLGVILMKQGKVDEAEAALRKSLELFGESLEVRTHLVELLDKKGDRAKAVKLAEELLLREAELAASDREILRKIAREK